jgi:hypothetical protein
MLRADRLCQEAMPADGSIVTRAAGIAVESIRKRGGVARGILTGLPSDPAGAAEVLPGEQGTITRWPVREFARCGSARPWVFYG